MISNSTPKLQTYSQGVIEEEVSSIFDALVKLAEYANDIYQDMKDPEPTRILEYLKSVVCLKQIRQKREMHGSTLSMSYCQN